jgi:P4 family phage/plasmid primase-like protien
MTAEPAPDDIDFTKYAGTGNPFLERLARGALLPDAPTPFWKALLRYDEHGDLDFDRSVDQVFGVPQDDVTAARAVLDRNDGQFFYVDVGKSGARGPVGEFRVWDGRVWRRDANEATVVRWITQFWRALHDAIERLDAHIESAVKQRQAELIATGMSEAEARKQAAAMGKAMSAKVTPIRAYHKGLGKNSGTNSLAARMTRRASVVVDEDDFDKTPGMLVVGNGVLDFTAAMDHRDPSLVALMPHDQIRRVHMMTEVEYHPDATCPVFMHYLETSLPDVDTRHYLHKALGYALLGMPVEKVMFNLTGPKDSGKTVLLKVLEALMASYAVSIAPGVLLAKRGGSDPEKPMPTLHSIRKARIVTASEPDHAGRWDHGLLKQITGNDTMTTRTLNKDNVRWTPQFSLFIASNHFVKLNTEDKALIERIAPIHFPNRFIRPSAELALEDIPVAQRADVGLEGRIKGSDAEMQGILAWMVEGLRLYLVEGLAQPLSVIRMRGVMEEESSTILQWLADRIEDGAITVLSDADAADRGPHAEVPLDYRVSLMEAHKDYLVWCRERDERFPEGWRKMGEKIGLRGSTEGVTVKSKSGAKVFDRLAWTGWKDGVRGLEIGRFGV